MNIIKSDGQYVKDEESEEEVEAEPPKENFHVPALITAKLTSGMEDRAVRNLYADFKRRSDSRFYPIRKRPIRHQDDIPKDKTVPRYFKMLERKALPLVYSSHSPISKLSPQFCIRPWVASLIFYGERDVPIGLFLEEFCFGDGGKVSQGRLQRVSSRSRAEILPE